MCFKWRALFESKPCLRKWFNTCSQLASSTMVRTSLLQVVRQQWGSSHPTEACNQSCWRQQCACILQVITRLCGNITDNYPKVTKEWKGHAGMEPSKTNKLDPKHFHTIPTSWAILPPLTQICFVFVTCDRQMDRQIKRDLRLDLHSLVWESNVVPAWHCVQLGRLLVSFTHIVHPITLEEHVSEMTKK